MRQITVNLFIADKTKNKLMKLFDLKEDYKEYVEVTTATLTLKENTEIDENFFMNIIEKSKADNDYWIPAIKYNGVMYRDEKINIL